MFYKIYFIQSPVNADVNHVKFLHNLCDSCTELENKLNSIERQTVIGFKRNTFFLCITTAWNHTTVIPLQIQSMYFSRGVNSSKVIHWIILIQK